VVTGRRSGGSSPFGEGLSSSKLLVTKPTSRRRRGPVEQQYVAIDLHRRRSLIVRQNEHGEELGVVRIYNDPVALSLAMAEAGPNPEVAIEATYGWVRHEAPYDRVGCEDPPAACRSRSLKLEAA
jgi:hypothetical protein